MTLVLLGLGVGMLSGLLGLGGGIFLVPALIYLYEMTPQQAAGTSLAVLIPPIGSLQPSSTGVAATSSSGSSDSSAPGSSSGPTGERSSCRTSRCRS